MSEFVLRFASKNRQKSGVSLSHDFTTKFNRAINLSYDMKHELAVQSLSMTYSWSNIRESYGNNQIKYSTDKGANWKTITFIDGVYSYDDINEYIKKTMKNNGDIFKKAADDVYGLDLYFILSTYKVLIELKGDYQVDLRNMDFRKLIGFESKIIDSTEYGKYLPDITRGVDEIHINCDIVKDSITDGQSSSTIAVIPVNDIVRSLPFKYEPRFLAYCPISGHSISSMRFYVTDSSGQPIDLNGIDWHIELIIRSK